MTKKLVPFLQKIEIFKYLSTHLLHQICKRAEILSYPPASYIIRKGEVGHCMFVLISGKVHIPVVNAKSEQLFTSELNAGDIFGEMALLTGHPRNNDVLAVEECTCLCLTKEIVEHLMRTEPDIVQVLTAILSKRTKRAGASPKVGKYTLLKKFAEGSMASVYNGYHPELERPLAIKMLHHELVYQPQFAERFRHEAKIIAHLRHPHIVEVFDLEEAYATFFIIMEKIKGTELHYIIQAQNKLSPVETRRILRQLLEALQFAHDEGVIHRDLKPSNIMIDHTGVKLMDFGIAYVPKQKEGLDESGMLLGTPHFMSPEQHRGEKVDHRADIYALGLIAYNMLTGTLPFHGRPNEIGKQKQKTKHIDIHKEAPDAPEDLREFILCATPKDLTKRAASCQQLANLLIPPEPSGHKVRDLSAKTVTFLYPPKQKKAVRKLLEKYEKQAALLPHVTCHNKY